jgi:hypothetical protein
MDPTKLASMFFPPRRAAAIMAVIPCLRVICGSKICTRFAVRTAILTPRSPMPKMTFAFSAFSAAPDLQAAKDEMTQRFLMDRTARPQGLALFSSAVSSAPNQNVVGVGIGEKEVEGKPTGVQALKFYVRCKILAAHLSPADTLPAMVNGLPTDIEEVGLFRALAKKAVPKARKARKAPPKSPKPVATAPVGPNPRQQLLPAQPGCSVGFRFPNQPDLRMAGTFGALVRDAGGTVYVLSNNHVLANVNRLPLGNPIFQPGLLDGGRPGRDRIADLTRFVKLDPQGANHFDAAIARAVDPAMVSRDILFIGPPAGVAAAQLDMIVHKFGRTTDYTVGRVIDVAADVSVVYNSVTLVFTNQILVRGLSEQPFSKAGDSGSLILQRSTNHAVGLLFAGSASHTIINHIQGVLDALNVQLA